MKRSRSVTASNLLASWGHRRSSISSTGMEPYCRRCASNANSTLPSSMLRTGPPNSAATRADGAAAGGSGAQGMKYLYVAATEEVEREALAAVTARVAAEFGGPVRSMELGSVEFAFDAQRRQYGSIPVLDMLLRRCPQDASKLLAVTERDLFIPVLTFVFGQAQLGGRVGVVS